MESCQRAPRRVTFRTRRAPLDSAKYLGLRATQEKLLAIKVSGDWHSTERALQLYRDPWGETNKNVDGRNVRAREWGSIPPGPRSVFSRMSREPPFFVRLSFKTRFGNVRAKKGE